MAGNQLLHITEEPEPNSRVYTCFLALSLFASNLGSRVNADEVVSQVSKYRWASRSMVSSPLGPRLLYKYIMGDVSEGLHLLTTINTTNK